MFLLSPMLSLIPVTLSLLKSLSNRLAQDAWLGVWFDVGFWYVVVRAGSDSLLGYFLVAKTRQHDYWRHLVQPNDGAEEVQPALSRQTIVQQHQINGLRLHDTDGSYGVISRMDLETHVVCYFLAAITDPAFIVYDQ